MDTKDMHPFMLLDIVAIILIRAMVEEIEDSAALNSMHIPFFQFQQLDFIPMINPR
jgi:hypothetical protein